jgi:osomolarity two-component system, sensor histidine kinase NIK1
LTSQVRSIAKVTKAVAGGDLTKKIDVDVRGEILELKETVNGMTESLSVFAAEVTRVAREVGTEGRLGGQATVMNVGGTWKDLTDNVNVMAANVRPFFRCYLIFVELTLWLQLTIQVRTIALATVSISHCYCTLSTPDRHPDCRRSRKLGPEGCRRRCFRRDVKPG